LGRSPGEGSGNPLQYSCLENPMDREAWWATVHAIAKSRTRLSSFKSLKKKKKKHLHHRSELIYQGYFSDSNANILLILFREKSKADRGKP